MPSTSPERGSAELKAQDGPPNGGLDAWLKVLGTHLIYISTWGLLNAYGSYVSYYESNLLRGHSSSDIAWPGTLQAVLIISVGVFTGPLFDRGYIRSLLLVGSFMVVFGMMMLSLSSKYYQIILSQGLCVGIGSGIVYVPCLALVSTQFSTKRAVAIALATCGAAIGGVVHPIALLRLLPLIGFGWATRVLAFMALFTFVLGNLLVLRNSSGLIKSRPPRSFLDTAALKESPFVAFCVAIFFIFLAYYVPFSYIPTYAQVKFAASGDFSVYLLAVTNAATFPSRIASAVAAQRFGALKTLTVCTAGSAVVLFGWFGVFSLAGFDVWVVFWGLIAGPLVTIPAAVVPLLCPDLSVLGTRMGMIWLCAALGGLVGAPVAGLLNNIPGKDFTGSQGLTAAAMAMGSALLLLIGLKGLFQHGG